ncbi:hypothetical protein [Bacillus cereus]|uniref:hypothetical protein n=1 Tax=Bacillus cereus TaxID=1396 RepID=UPI000BEDCC40|nr:hypothetical protein [Bacillus cereus]PDY76969.1 hypothetical protein CON06_27780 [Bacillus cereus]
MARTKKEDLADWGKNKGKTIPGFDDVADNETINEPENKFIIEPVQEDDEEHEHTTETKHEHDKFTEQFLKQFTEKVTKEDTHTRQTWLIKNETIKRLDKLAKGKRKGFKTELVNQALESFLDRIDK